MKRNTIESVKSWKQEKKTKFKLLLKEESSGDLLEIPLFYKAKNIIVCNAYITSIDYEKNGCIEGIAKLQIY